MRVSKLMIMAALCWLALGSPAGSNFEGHFVPLEHPISGRRVGLSNFELRRRAEPAATPCGLPDRIKAKLDSIVFSGQLKELRRQRYPDSSSVYQVSTPIAPAHLYKVDARGRRTQLTRGRDDDFAPEYSRSMGGVLFVRSTGKGKTNRMMFLPTGASKPRLIGALPHGERCWANISESGDTYVVYSGYWDDEAERLSVVYKGRVVKVLPAADYQIVPGSERIFVNAEGQPYFFDPSSGKISRIGWSEKRVAWLNSNKAMVTASMWAQDSEFRIRNFRGEEVATLPVKPAELEGMGPITIRPEADRVYTDTVVVVNEDHISDGEHPIGYRVDMISGNVSKLFDGEWCGTNDRGEFLSLTWEWVGSYKRGNERTGFLHRTSSNGKVSKQLTKYPMDVYGACWAPG